MTQEPCRRAFTSELLRLARADGRIVALASDSRGSVTLEEFSRELPGQFIEVGIAEQGMVGIAAGLAIMGKKPFVCGPASFLSMRCIEQIKVDVAYSELNVKLVGVSGGISYGPLGSTHHSLQDLAVMRAIPGISVVLPCDAHQTRCLTRLLADWDGPVYLRMGRNAVEDVYSESREFRLGEAVTLLEGDDVTLIGAGETVRLVLRAGRELRRLDVGARVIDLHTIKPLDRPAVLAAARQTRGIVTVEEHSVHGGLGAAVAELTAAENLCPVRILGFPDEPAVAGTPEEVFRHYGLTEEHIVEEALSLLHKTTCRGSEA